MPLIQPPVKSLKMVAEVEEILLEGVLEEILDLPLVLVVDVMLIAMAPVGVEVGIAEDVEVLSSVDILMDPLITRRRGSITKVL